MYESRGGVTDVEFDAWVGALDIDWPVLPDVLCMPLLLAESTWLCDVPHWCAGCSLSFSLFLFLSLSLCLSLSLSLSDLSISLGQVHTCTWTFGRTTVPPACGLPERSFLRDCPHPLWGLLGSTALDYADAQLPSFLFWLVGLVCDAKASW